MTRLALLLVILAAPAAVAAQPTPASAPAVSRAADLFQRDWVLMHWALKYHDSNHDILLAPGEAQAAAQAFRQIADTNSDGRVTPQEYRGAREFILARY